MRMKGSSLAEDPEVEAVKRRVKVIHPKAKELFLDIDDANSMAVFEAMSAVLRDNHHRVKLVKQTVSSGGNTHIYATIPSFKKLDPVMRIALQACLGSDRKRELLSLLRIVTKAKRAPTVFFENA